MSKPTPSPHEKIRQQICAECDNKQYTIGYVRELKCRRDCWIMQALDKTNKPKSKK